MADAQRRLLDFARRSVAPFSLFRRTLCSLRIPHGTPLQARRLLRDFARIDRHIAAGSAACTARRLRPSPCARGGNGNTQNRNATAMSSLMAHIPHGVGQHALSLFCWRTIDRKRALRRNATSSETTFLQNFTRDDRHIAAGSAACTARRLRPFHTLAACPTLCPKSPSATSFPYGAHPPMVQTKKLSVLRALRRGGGVVR